MFTDTCAVNLFSSYNVNNRYVDWYFNDVGTFLLPTSLLINNNNNKFIEIKINNNNNDDKLKNIIFI